jgi:hypothetical protein
VGGGIPSPFENGFSRPSADFSRGFHPAYGTGFIRSTSPPGSFLYPKPDGTRQVILLDFGAMLDESFAYAKEGVWERWTRWLLLMVSLIVFPLILGYMVKIFRGDRPSPDPAEWAPS